MTGIDLCGALPVGRLERKAGQWICLKGKVLLPPGVQATSWQWTINGEVVSSYETNDNRGRWRPVTDQQKQQQLVGFFPIKEETFLVRLVAVVMGMRCERSLNVIVKNATIVQPGGFTGTFAPRGVRIDTLIATPPNNYLAIALGNNAGDPQPGIKWEVRVRAPQLPGGNGEICFAQLMTSRATIGIPAGDPNFPAGTHVRATPGADPLLDVQFPAYHRTKVIPAAGVVDHEETDNPAVNLIARFQTRSIDAIFQLYLMYKPPDRSPQHRSIWVTVGKLDWWYKGSATRIGPGNVWRLDAIPAGQTRHSMPNPAIGASHTALPTWTRNNLVPPIPYVREP